MILSKRYQESILSYSKEINMKTLIKFYETAIDFANRLHFGNFSHGMSGLKYYLEYNETILHLKCDNEELKTMSYNMSNTMENAYLGMYKPEEKLQKLKEISKDCEYILKALKKNSTKTT